MRSLEESGGAFGSLDWLRFGYVGKGACKRQSMRGLVGTVTVINRTSTRSGDRLATDRSRGRIQPVNATHSLNFSAGVRKPSVLRGLPFNCLAMALS